MQQQLNNLLGGLTQGTGPQVTPLAFLLLMTVSLLSSLFIAYLYVHFYSNRATGSQVHRAFPLLGISVTAIFVTIQFSLPLSLGLLGPCRLCASARRSKSRKRSASSCW